MVQMASAKTQHISISLSYYLIGTTEYENVITDIIDYQISITGMKNQIDIIGTIDNQISMTCIADNQIYITQTFKSIVSATVDCWYHRLLYWFTSIHMYVAPL